MRWRFSHLGAEWRFGEPPPGARGAPEAHESLVSRETACGSAVDWAILDVLPVLVFHKPPPEYAA
ncbi:MAG: hypothetical protein NTX02_08380 [Planctomycetia bacterium]|nr:hypothetical protein [Planctomycetia bacterium]